MQLDRLYDAGSCANKAVALGLISTVTLDVAEEIEEMGFRRPEDNKSPQYSTARFEELTDLWEALDARDAERAEENQKREAKVSKDPLGYFCAAEDCGIVVTKKSTLRRCAGECPSAFKPSYCSKDCQKTVRFPPHTRVDGADLLYRIGNITGRRANRMLQNRVFVRLLAQVGPLPSGDRAPRRIRALKSPNQARSGPST